MAADANLIKDTDVAAKVRDVEFIRAFEDDVRTLTKILGAFKPIKRQPGTALKYYTTSGTLQTGKSIGEGEDIPLSKYSRSGQRIASLDWYKWAKATSFEAISKDGYAEAVRETDNQFIKDIQKIIRGDLVDFLQTGTGSATAGATLQKALANIWGQMQVDFEDTDADPIHFMSPLMVADYLGNATITTQTAFGMTYIEKFLGMYDTLLVSDIPVGTIITTPRENLHLYYADPSEVDGFDFYTGDETGYIGVHHEPAYKNLTSTTTAVTALRPFCDYLDKIYVTSVNPS